MLLADTPATWDDGPGMSTLNVLIVFVGGPLLIIGVITLLVMAPSIARGPRYRPSQQWDADAEWFGGPDEAAGTQPDASGQRQLEASSTTRRGDHDDHDDSGGASASW